LPRRKVINVLVLRIQLDFLLNNEAKNTKSTLNI
jgi:hypothetical protein